MQPRSPSGQIRAARSRGVRFLALLCLLVLLPPASGQTPAGDLVHNVFTVDEALDGWAMEHPDLVARFTLGQSVSGFPLHGAVITSPDPTALSTGEKLRIYLDGGHHGNEYLGVQILMYWVEDLLDAHAAGDAHAVELLRDNEIHVVPILNPEGNLRDTRYNGRAVDLNRNYDIGWDGGCVTPFSCINGQAPHSEPEVAANVAYVTALDPDLWVSTHTGIETLFWAQGDPDTPGDPFVPHAPDIGMFEALEVGFEAATNGRIDAYGGPAPAVGSAEDYGYGILGIPSFVYEVHNDQFFPAYDQPMRDMLQDQLAGLDHLVDNARFMGAWVELRDGRLVNEGWGPARNITLTGAGPTVIAEIPPGGSVPVDGSGHVSWSYPALLIDTSRERTHTLSAPEAATPGPAALLVVAALVGVAAVRTRRP